MLFQLASRFSFGCFVVLYKVVISPIDGCIVSAPYLFMWVCKVFLLGPSVSSERSTLVRIIGAHSLVI